MPREIHIKYGNAGHIVLNGVVARDTDGETVLVKEDAEVTFDFRGAPGWPKTLEPIGEGRFAVQYGPEDLPDHGLWHSGSIEAVLSDGTRAFERVNIKLY